MPAAKNAPNELEVISQKIKEVQVPEELVELLENRISRLSSLNVPFAEVERFVEYVDWVTSLPWDKTTRDVLDLESAKQVLASNHHGLVQIKERILEYISVAKLREERNLNTDSFRSPILCFVGLVGTGKTTIAASIAQALGRKLARIPFGGLGEVAMLRGRARFDQGGQPGQIIKALRSVEVKNPVILLDEIDRVEERERASIMGALVEILDPEQNKAFVDAFIDYPFNLSNVLFIVTANNTTNIATAVLDRLEVIQMPSYTDSEKIVIGRDFLLPRALREAGLKKEEVIFSETVWPLIVRPLGYDAGMRTLERTIQGIVRKITKLVVEGKGQMFQLNETNIKEFLPTW